MRVVVVGEGMVELSTAAEGRQFRHGGDALNTAIHLARLGHDVAFATALGRDPSSMRLRADWAAEGLNTRLILTDPRRSCGLYAIRTDAQGERSFRYRRRESAARALFALPGIDALLADAAGADLLFFSAISLAILPDAGRARLLALARAVRARGGTVGFDGNYRPRLWGGTGEPRVWRDAAIAVADIGLPTLDDERALSGEPDAAAVARHWHALGAGETVVKLGVDGCRLADGTLVPPPAVLQAVDTSGAGDAFDAGYLHARMTGHPPVAAAMVGHRLAGWAVSRRGAIPPADPRFYDALRVPSAGLLSH